ncbi:deoxyribodipyrimidine photolyase [Bythopirellula polymerisocia]|uniref:Deoxyribodipyrimidine photo-lyase n=1 Tax=Bythopirellula polymerisocia TaxID=2528003 RepID=A0A5C6CUY9_9BACT|nr:deoxyribodipyrimidine photolyase [Bythopirellula polymerisocia]TWU27474.1 Deoxyribodipyrimidine photo-lyase [Bythopirellula polymerisocia]
MNTAKLIREVPSLRIRVPNERDVQPNGRFVLYWMIANRRTRWNYSLQRAVEWAQELGKPLVILEALRCDYRWASDRLHRFVIQGMVDNEAALGKSPVTYYPYLEREPGEGSGLLAALAANACVVVSDDFPCFFLPKMISVAAKQIPCRFELVDSNGLLPMRATDKVFLRAYDFRRFLQKELKPHLFELPTANPLIEVKLPQLENLPVDVIKRWPPEDDVSLKQVADDLSEFPIDHSVGKALLSGGQRAADRQVKIFLDQRLSRYAEARNQPQQEVASGLSPYLHFGHISAHEIFASAMEHEQWSPDKLSEKATGSSTGWWGTSEAAESFLDELFTWRELGYNMSSKRGDYNRYSSLPDWAQATLAEHAEDPREHTYSLAEFEAALTHDELWNAAQRQLVREGRMHNYLRMLWGKKILEWSPTPQDSLAVMIELNNKYAVDGRNPNSYSGIFWVLGRYDRAWGPERPIFGKIRYMSSDNTARKVKVKEYIEKYGPNGQRDLF